MVNFKLEGVEFKSPDYWKHLDEYNKLIEECDKEGHLEPNEKKNICKYCFRDLKEKISPIEAELIADSKRNKKLHPMNRALNFGETLPIIQREEALKKWKNYYLGYDRYVESLKK